MTKRRNGPTRFGVLLGTLALLGLGAGIAPHAASVGTEIPSAPKVGELSVEPRQGQDNWGKIRLISSENCPPETTHFLIQASGGGLPENSNAVGNNELGEFMPGTTGKGMVVPLHATWADVARTNGAKKPLDGEVRLRLVCGDQFLQRTYAEMTGTVRFTRGSDDISSYVQQGGPTLHSGIPYSAVDEAKLAAEAGYLSDEDLAAVVKAAEAAQGSGATSTSAEAADALAATDPGVDVPNSDVKADAPEVTDTPNQAMASRTAEGGSSAKPVLIGGLLTMAVSAGGFLAVRRLRNDPTFGEFS